MLRSAKGVKLEAINRPSAPAPFSRASDGFMRGGLDDCADSLPEFPINQSMICMSHLGVPSSFLPETEERNHHHIYISDMEITLTPLSSCKVTQSVQSSTKVMRVPTAMLQPLYPSITISAIIFKVFPHMVHKIWAHA
eukprot:2762942-Prymnesium_polylepis.1